MAEPLAKHLLYGVQVILAREPVDNPWLDCRWRVVDLVLKDVHAGDGQEPVKNVPILPMRQHDGEADLYIAETAIDLHRAEAEAYAENLAAAEPSIYMVLRSDSVEGEDSEAGLRLVESACRPTTFRITKIAAKIRSKNCRWPGPFMSWYPSLLKPITTPMHSKSGSETVLTLRRCSRHVVTRGLTAVAMSLRRHQNPS